MIFGKKKAIGTGSSFARNTAIFTFMTFLQKGLGFVLLPIYTSVMTEEQNGIYSLVTSVFALYILIFSFALDDAVAKKYFEYIDDKDRQKRVVGTIVVTSLSFCFFGTALLFLLRPLLIDPFSAGIAFVPYIILGIVPVMMSSVYTILQKILLIEEKAFLYSASTLLFFIINTGLIILFVVGMGLEAFGMLLAAAITYAVFFVYSLILLRKRMKWCFDKAEAKNVIVYSAKLLPNRVASWGSSYLNNIIVGNLVSKAVLGVYAISLQFQNILIILANSLSHAVQPWVYRNLQNGSLMGKEKIFYSVSVLYSYIGLGVSLFTSTVLRWFFNEKYLGAGEYVPLLVLGATFSAISSLIVYVLFYYDDLVVWVSISTAVGVLFDLIVSLSLASSLGAWACAIATVCSAIVRTIIIVIKSKKRSGLKLNFVFMFGVAIVNFIVAQLCFDLNFWIKCAICVVEGVAILLYFRKINILKALKDN